MNVKRGRVVMFFAVLFAGLVSCGTLIPPEPTGFEYPGPPPEYTGLPKERPKAKVLTQFAASLIEQFDVQSGRIQIRKNRILPTRSTAIHPMKVDDLETVEEGSILVSPPTENAPFGFMKKVESVTEEANGDLIIETAPATLSEVIAGSDLKPEDVQQTTMKVPVEVYVSADSVKTDKTGKYLDIEAYKGNKFKPQFDIPVAETPNDMCQQATRTIVSGGGIKGTGCIKLKVWVTVDIDIGWWWIFPYLKGFGARASGFALANAKMELEQTVLDIQHKIPLPGDIKLPLFSNVVIPYVFFIGPIPIVITPTVGAEFFFGEGNITAQLETKATVTSDFAKWSLNLGTQEDPVYFGYYCHVGSHCENRNNWTTQYNRFKQNLLNPPTNPIQGEISMRGSLTLSYKAGLSLSAGAYIYGVVGFDAKVQPYVRPSLNVSAMTSVISTSPYVTKPRVSLSGGYGFGVTGKIDAGINLLFWQAQTNIMEGTIYNETYQQLFALCWIPGATC
jgi:hypothetical protein